MSSAAGCTWSMWPEVRHSMQAATPSECTMLVGPDRLGMLYSQSWGRVAGGVVSRRVRAHTQAGGASGW
jgi:hypothetical protein